MKAGSFLAGALVVCVLAAHASAALYTVTLSITSPQAHKWNAYAKVVGPCSGLSSFIIDVTGIKGLTVKTSRNGSPLYMDLGLAQQVGFSMFRGNGTAGIGISGAQATMFNAGDPIAPQLVIQDVGMAAGSHGSTHWSAKVLLAQGAYGGSGGTLRVRLGNGACNVLETVAGGDWVGPGNIATAPEVRVINGAKKIVAPVKSMALTAADLAAPPSTSLDAVGSVPEPATLALVLGGGLVALRRRR